MSGPRTADPNRDYFHVSRVLAYNPHADLVVGATVEATSNHNPFFGFYENPRIYSVTTPNETVQVPAMAFLRMVRDGGVQCSNLPPIAYEIAQHYVMLAREILMEQVRKELDENLPSRDMSVAV